MLIGRGMNGTGLTPEFLLFVKDKDGDENYNLYAVNPDEVRIQRVRKEIAGKLDASG